MCLSVHFWLYVPAGDEEIEGGHRGILIHETQALTEMVRTARAQGYRLEIHCIGDRAAEQVKRDLSGCLCTGVPVEHSDDMTYPAQYLIFTPC